MKKFLRLPPDDRQALIEETSSRLGGLTALMVEKDFWVCWTLERLFEDAISPQLLFKGGTSLSKGYGLIERFSEDIDLSFNRHEETSLKDPAADGIGKNEGKRRLEAITEHYRVFVAGEFRERLQSTFTQELSGVEGEWSLESDPAEAQNLLFYYPSILASPGDYIVKAVKMEFGGRSDHWPSERCTLRAYVAAEFPEVFSAPDVTVRALSPVRTFWEKATILHSEYHRTHPDLGEKQRSVKARSSRHWYDLMRMSGDAVLCGRALSDDSLLAAVAAHKALFYKDPKSKYEEAKRGSLKLSPHPDLEAALRADYAKMEAMFFHTPPTFDDVLNELRLLEAQVNYLGSQ